MPKVTKLHAKGKPQSIQKHHNPSEPGTDNLDPEESARQFQLELCWCIQQLEKTLVEKKGNEKQLQEVWKVLTILKNNNQPLIRKRQLMRTHFGDYRAKMNAEEKKLVKMASKMKIGESTVQPKATFVRKSAFLTTGDSSFRFNFDLTSDQTDNGQPQPGENDTIGTSTNTDAKDVPVIDDNSKTFKFKFTSSEFKFNFSQDNS